MYEKEREDQIKLHMLLDSDEYVPYALSEEDILKIKKIDEALGLLTNTEQTEYGRDRKSSLCDSIPDQSGDERDMAADSDVIDANSPGIQGVRRGSTGSRIRNKLSRKASECTMRGQGEREEARRREGIRTSVPSRKASNCSVEDGGSRSGDRSSYNNPCEAVGRVDADGIDGKIRPLNRRLGDSYLTNQVRSAVDETFLLRNTPHNVCAHQITVSLSISDLNSSPPSLYLKYLVLPCLPPPFHPFPPLHFLFFPFPPFLYPPLSSFPLLPSLFFPFLHLFPRGQTENRKSMRRLLTGSCPNAAPG